MRKTILSITAFLTLALVSCKKDRVCECTNTQIDSNPLYGGTDVTVDKYTVKKVSKKWMKTYGSCVSTESSTTENGIIGYDTWGDPIYGNYSVIYKSDCEIK